MIKIVPAFKAENVLKKFLRPVGICKKILHFKKIGSTQTKIKNFAQKGFPEGTVVIADEQSASYGRMQRKWFSPAGGLWFSMLLKPKIYPDAASNLSLLTALALNAALEKDYGIKTKIKWPNDILFEDKIIAGIIIEMSAEQDIVNWVAAGVGVNIDNILPDTLPEAAALGKIFKKNIRRDELLASFLIEFNKIYNTFCKFGFGGFCEEYNKNHAFMNESVIIDGGFGIIKGINKGIGEDGKIIIETEKGIEKIISGTLRRSG
ncbi:MAG: biotin--[acetyl-CoA-carboxylase] ligase [Endomicrobium sp.]|jgi:BirA family biotin operon repressor/biotin-[acetyl-CoA-carboxylase] ligase|nr:biotin--[acetyl-CoA-carboxylase] ligase [Endomicrobium sp.]